MVAAQKLTDLRPVSLEEILSSDPDPSTETVQQSEDILQTKIASPQSEEFLGHATTEAHIKEQIHHVNRKEEDTPAAVATASTGAVTVIVTTPPGYDRQYPWKVAASRPDYLVASLIVLLFIAVLGPWIERGFRFVGRVSREKFLQFSVYVPYDTVMVSVIVDVDYAFAHFRFLRSVLHSGDPLVVTCLKTSQS